MEAATELDRLGGGRRWLFHAVTRRNEEEEALTLCGTCSESMSHSQQQHGCDERTAILFNHAVRQSLEQGNIQTRQSSVMSQGPNP